MTHDTHIEGPVRVGVVGCGCFGSLHAEKYAHTAGAELVAVADIDRSAAHRAADKFGAEAYYAAEDMIGRVDAVSIVTPASCHYEIAALFLREGVHVLVEKPVTIRVSHVDELISLADEKRLVLQVGHQERFVFEKFGLPLPDMAPRRIKARRVGSFTGRGTDVNVVFDLMIHDLDLVCQVTSSDIVSIQAEGTAVYGSYHDEVSALLELANGCKVELLASRTRKECARDFRLEYEDGAIKVDFMNGTLRNSTPAKLPAKMNGTRIGPDAFEDPLGCGIKAFVNAVRNVSPPRVSAKGVRKAVQAACMITERLAA